MILETETEMIEAAQKIKEDGEQSNAGTSGADKPAEMVNEAHFRMDLLPKENYRNHVQGKSKQRMILHRSRMIKPTTSHAHAHAHAWSQ